MKTASNKKNMRPIVIDCMALRYDSYKCQSRAPSVENNWAGGEWRGQSKI